MTGTRNLLWIFCFTISFCSAQDAENMLREFPSHGKSLRLFVFLSPDCPLSRNYTKAINEFTTTYHSNVLVFGIIPGTAYTIDEIEQFRKKYKTAFSLFTDTSMAVTNFLHASITPEAILLDSTGNTIYMGAIDDWVETLGKNKLKPTRFYVKDAIDQYLSSSMILVKKTKAVGCKINDY